MSKKFTVKKHDGTVLFQVDIDGTVTIPGSINAGAVVIDGGSTAGAISLYDQVINEDMIIPPGKNALSVGPVTIADGKTVTVSDGSYWVVI